MHKENEMSSIELDKYPVKPVLSRLLQDKTTKKNIIFATDIYEGFSETDEITEESLKAINLKTRVDKKAELQRSRTRSMAEVFTPSWVCNKMNNHCDEEWFGRPGVFNREDGENWITNPDKIEFPEYLSWQNYIDSRRIEITCGEAPYMVSRYDTTTGEYIDIQNRIGILDRKLRVVNENAGEEWLDWAIRTFQSVYGFEFQGDNLLIARINLLYTFVEYYKDRFNEDPDNALLRKIANIIVWNFWQMDGITDTIPYGNAESEEGEQTSFFDIIMPAEEEEKKTPICRIFDWRSNESVKYTDLKKGDK